ncbi:MAG: DUF1517 domain-containing protein [Sandaracinaceae bacterium]|nr:DUF1517 domain-containing protein [Sandaracinaceae bacterium]
MNARVWTVLFAVLLSLLLVGGDAVAQSSGGSFGGGSFGRSSESSGSSGSWGGGSSGSSGSWGGGSSSSSSWGGSSSSGGYSSSGGGGGGGGGLMGGLCCFLFIGGIVGLVIVANLFKKKGGGAAAAPGAPPGPAAYHGPDAMYVSRLSIGIDWRARRDVQATLTRLAQSGDTSSPQGLANLLRETVLALRRAEMSWLYVSQESFGPIAPQSAEQQFRQIAMSQRSRFQKETVRAGWGGGVQQQDAGPMQAHKNEGEGTVVVSVIVAAYRALQPMQGADANQLRAALDNRAALTADQLGALEVVWSPSEENDRMSTAELEQNYPEMQLVDPNSIAGRIFCTYCQGPFAMELLSCPHCGAPAEASRDNRAPRRG